MRSGRPLVVLALTVGLLTGCASGDDTGVGEATVASDPPTTLPPVTTTTTSSTTTTTEPPRFAPELEAEVVAACAATGDRATCECVVRRAAGTMTEERFVVLLEQQADVAAVPELVELVEACRGG